MSIQDFMNLSYDFVIKKITDESGTYYHATIWEFEGCQSTGDTYQEAYEGLKEAMEGWIEAKLLNGKEVPLPMNAENYSGKFIVRLPKSLHYKLVKEATHEGVSLNQYALYKLSL